ncbi:hypothetical protein DBR37_01585 [Herminiimonas sp. KBW02]|uniref:hypothetical protein n=1 Tax=Herminiimonas sp. KBW02 TaxID=2153363 RepID=UPI000F5B4A1C|nr:hypothetical protein [Herminiimonas sp. KBW02]RQO38614.1 hypothetical protein DBR37_01585 [Herminiimonas sp. KBW02]
MSGGISATTVAMYAAAASAALGAYTALENGAQQKNQMNYQAEQAQADADAAASQSQVEAAQIRKAVQRQRASARAALSESGVNVDVGTGELIQSDIEQEGEKDALTTIYNGSTARNKLKAQAQGFTIAGKNAQSAGYMNAANSALSGVSSFYGWKTKSTSGGRG